MDNQKIALTVPEAAKRLGLGKSTAWKYVWDGTIPSCTIGARRLVLISALDQWIADRTKANSTGAK